MTLRNLIGQCGRCGGRLCLACLNLVLGLIALVLGGLVCSLTLFQSVPIPQFLVQQAEAKLANAGLTFEYSSLTSSLRGEVILDNLEVRETHSGNTILTCRRAVAHFGFFDKLMGDPLVLDSLQLEDASLFGPPEISPFPDQALAQIVVLDLTLNPEAATVNRMLGQLDTFRINLSGTLPIQMTAELLAINEASTEQPWRKHWANMAEVLGILRVQAALARNVSLKVASNSQGPERAVEILLEATVPQIELPGGVVLKEVHALIPSILPQQRQIRTAYLRAAQVDLANHGTARRLHLSLSGDPVEQTDWHLPPLIQLDTILTSQLVPEVGLALTSEMASLRMAPQLTGRAQVTGLHLEFDGLWDPQDRQLALNYSLAGSPDRLLDHPIAALEAVREVVRFPGEMRMVGNGRWASSEDFSAQFDLQARNFWTRETHYDEVRTRVRLSPEQLLAYPIEVYDPADQAARGAFIQNLRNKRFRILGRGAIFPRRLDSLLPPFYEELWEDIDPGHNAVEGDVDVRGIWGTEGRTAALVTARGRNLAYRKQPVDAVFLRLWQASGFVELFDLQVASGGGALEGQIGILFPQTEDAFSRIRLQLDAELPLEILAGAFGGEVEQLPDYLISAVPPKVRIEGDMVQVSEDHYDKNLRITAQSPGPVMAMGVPLDRLDVTAHLQGDLLTLAPLRFGIARGHGSARATVQGIQAETRRIALDLRLDEAEYTTIHRIVRRLSAKDEDTPQPEDPLWANLAPGERGRLRLELETRGTLGEWDSYTGRGKVAITGAPLGQVNIFGGLSRLFSNLGLGFSTFRLEDLASELVLAPGLIGFPNLEVRGPTLRIESQGKVAVPASTLNFDAKLFFLDPQNPSILSLFGLLLRPVGHALEVSVSGPAQEPVWQFRHNPLNTSRPAEKQAPPRPQLPDTGVLTPAE